MSAIATMQSDFQSRLEAALAEAQRHFKLRPRVETSREFLDRTYTGKPLTAPFRSHVEARLIRMIQDRNDFHPNLLGTAQQQKDRARDSIRYFIREIRAKRATFGDDYGRSAR